MTPSKTSLCGDSEIDEVLLGLTVRIAEVGDQLSGQYSDLMEASNPRSHDLTSNDSTCPAKDVSSNKQEAAPYQGFATSNDEDRPKEEKRMLQTLPLEIRFRIYEYALVSRSHDESWKAWKGETNITRETSLLFFYDPATSVEASALLRTCKQINHEATPFLYRQIVFKIDFERNFLKLVGQMGAENFAMLRSVDICISNTGFCTDDERPWLNVFDILAKEATGLRHVKLGFAGFKAKQNRGCTGLGASVAIIQAVGRLKELRSIMLYGYYAKPWPRFLEDKLSLCVQTWPGNLEEVKSIRRDMRESEKDSEKRKRWRNRNVHTPAFREFQKGTEQLDPWA